MKRALSLILIVAVLFAALILCCDVGNGSFAYADNVVAEPAADTEEDVDGNGLDDLPKELDAQLHTDFFGDKWISVKVGNKRAHLYPVKSNGFFVGVRMYGYFFGHSDIAVDVEVYTSNALPLNFPIYEESKNLTTQQLESRKTGVELLVNVFQMINDVDRAVNASYDGAVNANYDGNEVALGEKSDIYRYNVAHQGETVNVSRYTYEMLQYARNMYLDTNGAFNPAVYRLVDLWGFSSRVQTYGGLNNPPYGKQPYDRIVYDVDGNLIDTPPAQKYVNAFSKPSFIDFSDNAVRFADNGDGTYSVTKNVAPVEVDGVKFDQWLDLGGIAKGYVADKAREMIRALGIDRFNVNAGDSSIATGDYVNARTEDGKVVIETVTPKIGMADSFDKENFYPPALFVVEVGKASISTSGQYVRKYTYDGVEYSHIIDGSTGAPAQTGVREVMIVVPEELGAYWSTMGDCLTTALTVMGRDKIVEFANGYLKEHGIKFAVQYQTFDGKKQLLSNFDKSELTPIAPSFAEFGWALKLDENGKYYYDAQAENDFYTPKQSYTVLLAILGSVLGAGLVALIVYHFIRGKKRTATNVANAKKEKPFKPLDVMMYIGVAIVIMVLFFEFVLNTDTNQMQMVKVIDDETNEVLLIYNVTRLEGVVNTQSTNGWQIEIVEVDDGVNIILSRQIHGEDRYNTLHIKRGVVPTVEMSESRCGYHQDCVYNFSAISRSGGTIVCSPNRLKVITE